MCYLNASLHLFKDLMSDSRFAKELELPGRQNTRRRDMVGGGEFTGNTSPELTFGRNAYRTTWRSSNSQCCQVEFGTNEWFDPFDSAEPQGQQAGIALDANMKIEKWATLTLVRDPVCQVGNRDCG